MKKIFRYLVTLAGLVWVIEIACLLFTGLILDILGTIFGFSLRDPYYSMLKDIFGVPFDSGVRIMILSAVLWLIPPIRRAIGRGIVDIGSAVMWCGLALNGPTYIERLLEQPHVKKESEDSV